MTSTIKSEQPKPETTATATAKVSEAGGQVASTTTPTVPRSRFMIVGALLLVSLISVQLLRRGYQHSIRPTALPIAELPLQLGNWAGVDQQEMDERTAGVLGADQTLGRTYSRGDDGERVGVHMAVWSSMDEAPDPAPHHPETCYTGAGYQVLDRLVESVPTPAGDVRVEYLLMDMKGAKVVTAHWFQIGENVIVNKNEGRKVHQSLWGQSEWPSTVKVLMQISKPSFTDAKVVLDDLIAEVYGWTSKLDQAG